MVAKDFSPGDLVWAKMKGYPPWPAKVMEPPNNAKSPSKPKKPQHYVLFFGSENYAWILDENIFHHSEEMIPTNLKKKSAQFQSAIDTILEKSRSQPKKPKMTKPDSQPMEKVKTPQLNNIHKKKEKLQISSNKSTEKKSKLKDSSTPHKKAKKRPISNDRDSELSPCPKSRRTDDEYSALLANVPPNVLNTKYDETSVQSSGGILARPAYVERPPTPSLDVETMCEVLKMKHVQPTNKKIGFLGLGIIGRGIVKNLLNSGHFVTVWNRTPQKCDTFIAAGAHRGQTPADVVACSDITFCCVSDPDAAKSLVFGNCGVLKGLEQDGEDKGYVEMTSVDPETSQEIAEAIGLKRGKYLEAHINGSRKQAEEGTLFILAAGERSLFSDCTTCFHAMGKHAYYISCAVGSGSKMNLVLSMLHGTVYSALAESMALVERLKLSQNDFIEILEMSTMHCPAVVDKGQAIIIRDFGANTALKHIQKDLKLALRLGDICNQPMPIAAAANEVYKHAKQLRYSDHDVCAVYQGIKY